VDSKVEKKKRKETLGGEYLKKRGGLVKEELPGPTVKGYFGGFGVPEQNIRSGPSDVKKSGLDREGRAKK